MSVNKIKITDRQGNILSEDVLTPITNVSVTIDNNTGTPEASATFEDGELVLSFSNMKGNTGATGPEGASFQPIEDISGLVLAHTTGNDNTKAMSQKGVTDNITFDDEIALTDNPIITNRNWYINSENKWIDGSVGNTSISFPVSEGKTLKVVGGSEPYNVEFLSSWNAVYGTTPAFADTVEGRIGFKTGTRYYTIPNGAKLAYVRKNTSSTNCLPSYIGYSSHIKERVVGVEEECSTIKTDVSTFKFVYVPIDLSAKGISTSYYFTGENKWLDGLNTNGSIFLPVVAGKLYRVGSDVADKYWQAFFVTKRTYSTNDPASLPSGQSTSSMSYVTGWRTLEAPSSAVYLYIRSKSSDSNVVCPTVERADIVNDAASVSQFTIDDFKSNLIKNAKYTPKYIDIEPSASDISNCVLRNNAYPNNIYSPSDSSPILWRQTLAWLPKVQVVGGGVLTLHMTGDVRVEVHELAYRDLDVLPIDAKFKSTDIIKRTVFSLPMSETDATLTLHPSTKRVVIYSPFGSNVTPSDMSDAITSINIPIATDSDWSFGGGESENSKMSLVASAHWTSPARTAQWPMLGLLHYSDIHASTKSANQLRAAAIEYNSYIDDILCTGDVVRYNAGATAGSSDDTNNGLGWWNASGLADISLFSLGNHDCSTNNNPGMNKDVAWSHDKYYAEHLTALGYVMPDGWDNSESPYYKATYWHKDYAQQKIRLICIDAPHHFDGVLVPSTGEIDTSSEHGHGYEMEDNNAQELWLIEKLNETLAGSGNTAEGYSVLIASHFPLDDFGTAAGGSTYNKTWDDEEHTWVVNKNDDGGMVSDVKTNGSMVNFHDMSVSGFVADGVFHLRNRVKKVVTENDPTKGDVNNIGNIVQYWMENNFVPVNDTTGKNPYALGWYELKNGEYVFSSDSTPQQGKTYYTGAKFVAWLCGHVHRDMMFYPKRYPNILNIGITQAGERRDEYEINRDDVCLTANLVFFDTYLHHIKIIRVGNTNNLHLRPVNFMSYHYANRNVISQG